MDRQPGAGSLPARSTPIAYDPDFAWDRRYLAAAVELGDELTNPVEPFTRSLPPGEGHSPGFFRILLWHYVGWADYKGHPYLMGTTVWLSLIGVVTFGSVVAHDRSTRRQGRSTPTRTTIGSCAASSR